MKKIDEKALKNLIKNSFIRKPSDDLTSSIIAQIALEHKTELEDEKALTSLLKKASEQEVAIDLSEKIVSQLKTKTQLKIKPLVNKNIKYGYGILMVLGIVYLIINGNANSQDFMDVFNFIDFEKNKLIPITTLVVILITFLDVLIKRYFIPSTSNEKLVV